MGKKTVGFEKIRQHLMTDFKKNKNSKQKSTKVLFFKEVFFVNGFI